MGASEDSSTVQTVTCGLVTPLEIKIVDALRYIGGRKFGISRLSGLRT